MLQCLFFSVSLSVSRVFSLFPVVPVPVTCVRAQVPPFIIWDDSEGDLHWVLPAWLWGRVLRRPTNEKACMLLQTYDTRLVGQGVTSVGERKRLNLIHRPPAASSVLSCKTNHRSVIFFV